MSAVLCLSAALFARAQDPKASDVTNNGNYRIARCGHDSPGGKADQLVSLLQEIGGDLPTISVEANIGTDSVYGFKSLFKSNDNIATVTANFGHLSDSETVTVDGREEQVTFVCLEPDDPDPATNAVYNMIMRDQPRGAAYNQFGSANIYLTPFFFDELKRNPEPYRCPLFRRTRLAINGDDILGTTQYGIIIHELMDKYLHFTRLDQPEVYNLKQCIDLPQEQQVQNAENYAMFASALKAGCNKFPR